MNPLLGKLHPYPFERLRELTGDIVPNPALRPISLGIGEPRHATPALDAALKRAAHALVRLWQKQRRPARQPLRAVAPSPAF